MLQSCIFISNCILYISDSTKFSQRDCIPIGVNIHQRRRDWNAFIALAVRGSVWSMAGCSYSNIACRSCLRWRSAMASGFREAWADLHFSRLTNTGDGLLQSWATVLLRLGLLGRRITGQCPLATALGFAHRTYCLCTERGSKMWPRQSVRRCWAGHDCRDLYTPSTLCSLLPHPPQSSLSASHLSTPLSLQCGSSEWCCQNTTWPPNAPWASLGTATLFSGVGNSLCHFNSTKPLHYRHQGS